MCGILDPLPLGPFALSPDGQHACTAAYRDDDISIYSREPATGALALLQRCVPYQADQPCRRMTKGQAISAKALGDGIAV